MPSETKKNKKNKQPKITKEMINTENVEIKKVTDILLGSLTKNIDIFGKKRTKELKKKLKGICEQIQKRNENLLNTKSSNKMKGGGVGDEDIENITNEARDIITNNFATHINNGTQQNELPVVTETQARDFTNNITESINSITIQRGDNRTLYHTNLNVTGQVTNLGVLALQSPDESIRLRAFDALLDPIENENRRDREKRYLANTVFLITFIGGIVMTYQVWRVFSVITNVSGGINGLTAPTPAPTPGWGDYVSGIFSGPTTAPVEQEPPTWWDWIGSGGQFGLNRLFYVMHVISSFLYELIFLSQIGATMATFIFSTFVAIALWHVMDGGFNVTTFGFGFSTGIQHRLRQPQQPVLMNQQTQQQQQPQQRVLTNQNQQPQQRVLMNQQTQQQQQPPDNINGGKKRRRKKTHNKKSKKRRAKKVKKTRKKGKKKRKGKKSKRSKK